MPVFVTWVVGAFATGAAAIDTATPVAVAGIPGLDVPAQSLVTVLQTSSIAAYFASLLLPGLPLPARLLRRLRLGAAAAVGACAAVLGTVPLVMERGASWQLAGAVLVLAATLALGLLVLTDWVLRRPVRRRLQGAVRSLGPMPSTSRLAWVGRHGDRVPVIVFGVLTAGMTVWCAATLVSNEGAGAAILLTPMAIMWVIVVIAFIGSELTVSIDARGVRVATRWLGIPLSCIPLERIEHAEAGVVDVFEWGGYGTSFEPGRHALLAGTGPALIVTERGGNEFAVSLEDPLTPAAVLSSLLARRAT